VILNEVKIEFHFNIANVNLKNRLNLNPQNSGNLSLNLNFRDYAIYSFYNQFTYEFQAFFFLLKALQRRCD
jgi:hypothetical protein